MPADIKTRPQKGKEVDEPHAIGVGINFFNVIHITEMVVLFC